MKRLLVTSLFILLTLTLPACGQSMKQPDIHLNPQPKMRYEITLTVQDAPGPFESVTAYANYETDDACVPAAPITAANYGARYPIRHSVLVAFHRLSADTYKGTVHMDLLRDEDYYGLGVCRWHITSFSAPMKAGDATFSASISGEEIASKRLKVEYFAKKIYGKEIDAPRQTVPEGLHMTPGLRVSGVPRSEWIARQPDEFFSTTLTAKEQFE